MDGDFFVVADVHDAIRVHVAGHGEAFARLGEDLEEGPGNLRAFEHFIDEVHGVVTPFGGHGDGHGDARGLHPGDWRARRVLHRF